MYKIKPETSISFYFIVSWLYSIYPYSAWLATRLIVTVSVLCILLACFQWLLPIIFIVICSLLFIADCFYCNKLNFHKYIHLLGYQCQMVQLYILRVLQSILYLYLGVCMYVYICCYMDIYYIYIYQAGFPYSLYKVLASAVHMLKLERYREDQHGPCGVVPFGNG